LINIDFKDEINKFRQTIKERVSGLDSRQKEIYEEFNLKIEKVIG
jgi:hypothetical protein